MDKDELIGRLDTPDKTHMVTYCISMVEQFDLSVADLFEISFHKKKEIAFRAAWMLEYVMMHYPDKFVVHVPRLLELLPTQKNHSAMRHYTKMIALLTDRKANPIYRKLVMELNFDSIIPLLFDLLLDSGTLVASKVHCMQSLANMAPGYDWIKDDLLATIDHLVELESIAFFARAKQVRKQLNKIK